MISLLKRPAVSIALFCLLPAAGCVNLGKGTVDPTNYYLLSARGWEDGGEITGQEKGLVIGVGPVSIPGYLKRNHIVTRDTDNKILLAEFHRWAEHLEDGIPRVIAEDISVRLPGDWVAVYPWRRDVQPDYRVVVDVYRLDAVFKGDAVLNVQWTLYGPGRRDVLLKKQTDYSRPAGGESYEDIVAAMSLLFEDLSQDIVAAIENSSGQRSKSKDQGSK